ncbi:uncharacterized protein LOC111345831 isoform X2 [Stylophora pistillata]|uniref:uncharacterized protein LOC111345831 isoform X2 n=1 Tax=Stylophora pistillata TaxID=50429 RepID=UPI000C03C9CA|nr:uncharacterized protein LOC111345831 isoform X2 [Stylophora pistillata]
MMQSGDDLCFDYKDRIDETITVVMANQPARDAIAVGALQGLRNRSRGQRRPNPFSPPQTGYPPVNKNGQSWPVKLLMLLVYKAAQINNLDLLQFIFRTSAGTSVFNRYKNNDVLPEDVARANGNAFLGNYLENMNKRLSTEVGGDDNIETIHWLELKHALEEKQNLHGTDDAQPVGYPDCDVNQSDYEADDEVTSSSSPSSTDADGSEIDDSERKDHGQNKMDCKLSHEQEVSASVLDAVTNVASHLNQERADPAENHADVELGSRIGTNRTASCQNMEPMDSMSRVGPCLQTTTKNTFWKQFCDETDQKEEQDNLDHLVYNQEGTDAADDHVFTSAVTTISGVSKNFTKRGSEVEKSSKASRHIQEAISSVTRVLPCTENVERLVGPFIQTKTENTLYEGTCDKRGQEEELDNHEELTGVADDSQTLAVDFLSKPKYSGCWHMTSGVSIPPLLRMDNRRDIQTSEESPVNTSTAFPACNSSQATRAQLAKLKNPKPFDASATLPADEVRNYTCTYLVF